MYDDIIKILQYDSMLDTLIQYEKANIDIPACMDYILGKLFFLDCLIPHAMNFYNNCSYLPNYNEEDSFKYKFALVLFHELAHLKQRDYAKKEKSLLGTIYKKCYEEGNRNEDHYNSNPLDYFFEYNANLESTKILSYLFCENEFLMILNYFDFYGDSIKCIL